MGIWEMNNKILYGIISVAFVGGLFSAVYAGPILPTITLAGTVDMVNNQIKNLQDPTDPQDAATKAFVESLFSCDGAGQSCVVGLGECQNSGINVCVMGSAQCTVSAGASSPEICDSLDNDCDGTSDEDFPTVGDSCSVGLGICQSNGNLVCSQDKTAVECDAVPGTPQNEICNNLDEDCNGLVDDNCVLCDPLNPEPVCGANMACLPRQAGNPLCLPAGTGTQGDACTNNLDCAPTLGCLGFNNVFQCRQLCAVSNPICPMGTTCTSFLLFIGNEEYGACI